MHCNVVCVFVFVFVFVFYWLELVQFTFSFVLYLYRDIIDNVKSEIIFRFKICLVLLKISIVCAGKYNIQMAIWRKFIPWDAPTGARQYNNACPHHLLNVCDINENWTNLCRSYALYSQILQSVQQSFSQIGWCHVWLWHIVTWQDFEGGLEKIRHNTVTARHCHPLLLLHYILCFCSSSASAAALQLRFKLLLLLCFVYMVGSCVLYCPWLALV